MAYTETIVGVTEIDFGIVAKKSGSFDITGLVDLFATRTIIVTQTAGPYTGKGTLADEAEMDQVTVTTYPLNTTTARCYWVGSGMMAGKIKFNYQIIIN